MTFIVPCWIYMFPIDLANLIPRGRKKGFWSEGLDPEPPSGADSSESHRLPPQPPVFLFRSLPRWARTPKIQQNLVKTLKHRLKVIFKSPKSPEFNHVLV